MGLVLGSTLVYTDSTRSLFIPDCFEFDPKAVNGSSRQSARSLMAMSKAAPIAKKQMRFDGHALWALSPSSRYQPYPFKHIFLSPTHNLSAFPHVTTPFLTALRRVSAAAVSWYLLELPGQWGHQKRHQPVLRRHVRPFSGVRGDTGFTVHVPLHPASLPPHTLCDPAHLEPRGMQSTPCPLAQQHSGLLPPGGGGGGGVLTPPGSLDL